MESTKSQLAETELLLAEIKSQLASAQKANSLSEIKLKCMVESYNSLETRNEELQAEVNRLQAKIGSLDNHQDTLASCKDFDEHLQRRRRRGEEAFICDRKIECWSEGTTATFLDVDSCVLVGK
ncbi:filament-like plant protein 4 isoform X2 [Solanum lycopersicum]|uniref:filament-like plant protein 4 isoform X2 n=1 Tax=Solanum lycopersicum TaxID=4081 RepID=UPI000276AC19